MTLTFLALYYTVFALETMMAYLQEYVASKSLHYVHKRDFFLKILKISFDEYL